MKGRWVTDLIARVLEKEVTPGEAVRYTLARYLPKPTQFSMEHIQFKNADHTTWAIVWEIFLARRYCPDGFEIGANDVVVDIGAHRGIFTAFAAKRTRAQVISIEPNPENFAVLCKFREENRWKNVQTIQGAVAPEPGFIQLFQSGSSSRHTISGVDPVNKQVQSNSIQVQAYTLGDILQNITKVDFLKIDCEGAEYAILLNSGDLLKRVKRISMEIHLQTPGADLEGLHLFLKKYYRNIRIVKESSALGYLFAS